MLPNAYHSLGSVITNQLSLEHRKFVLFENYRPHFRWKWLKNKGAMIILFWSFAGFMVLNFFFDNFYYRIQQALFKHKSTLWIESIAAIMFPVFGWFADIYFGRYKVIKASMVFFWVGAILYGLSSALQLVAAGAAGNIFKVLSFLCAYFGLSGFQVNIIQFLIDQLLDSSSSEILFFSRMYVWLYFLSNAITKVNFILHLPSNYQSVFPLLLAVLMTLAVSSDFLFNHWLVKEPVSHNPLKLILRVLKYAVQNSHPRQRSAFTYCDDKPYSRLDLGKSKYGGPFTTEQVEDVKTFFRILSIVIMTTIVLGLLSNIGRISEASFAMNFKGYKNCSIKGCYSRYVSAIGSAVVALGMPVWELCVLPLLQKCFLRKLKVLVKASFGYAFLLLHIASLITVELIGESRWQKLNPNQNLSCVFENSTYTIINDYNISSGWLAFPSIFSEVGVSWMMVGMIEFVVAQSPYAMKGLIYGIGYFNVMFSVIMFYYLPLIFRSEPFKSGGTLGCVFWFLLASLIVTLLFWMGYVLACCCYKNRQREDNLPNQHCFAESYYGRYIDNNDGNIS